MSAINSKLVVNVMQEFELKMDYYGLLNLHKVLLEAKFHTTPDNELVSGSPLVADIYIQVRELLISSDKSAQWKNWFQLKNRQDYRNCALTRILTDERWSKSSFDEKKKIASDYLAPFLYDEIELQEFVIDVDCKNQRL